MDVYGRLLCVTLILVAGLLPYTGAQHSVSNLVYGFCNRAQYSSNGSFASNLNTVVGVLTQGSSKALYALAKSESGPSNDSYVYAMYQCRGDVSLSACSSCVSAAFSICGPALGARGQFEGCFIRDENFNFSADIPASGPVMVVPPSCSAANDSSSLYQRNLASALNRSATVAPRHALFGYSASSVGTGSTRAFALTQCLGYLSPSQCADCLSHVSNYSTQCNTSVWGQVYYDQCYYVFNHTSFLFTTATVPSPAPTPLLVPTPAPVPVPAPAPAPALVPLPSTILGPTPPSPTVVFSPLQPPKASTPSGSQETSKTGGTIMSIVITLVASSLATIL